MRRFIIIALASLAPLAHAETVKTASQPWVDMRIADATNAVSQSVRESSSNLTEMVDEEMSQLRSDITDLVSAKADAGRSNWDYYTTNGLWYARLSDDWCWERQTAPTGAIPAGAPLVDSIAHTNGAWTAQFSERVVNYTISPASGLDADVVTVTARYSWGTFPAYSITTLIRTNALDHAVVYTDTLAYATNAVVKMVDERCSPIPALVNDVEDLYYDKQDVINDLETIRAGAAAGATALQEERDPTVTNAIISAIEYIESVETTASAAYTGVSRDTELVNGKLILFRLGSTPSGNWTLNLTLADGSTTGAKPTYIVGTTQLAKRYGAGYIVPLIYRNGAWYAASDYNSDANNYDRNVVTYCKAAEAIAANVLAVGTTNGYYKLAAGRTFDLDLPILFCNGAQTAGKTNGNNWYSNYTGVNLATTLAGWAGDATTRGMPVFLLGSVDYSARTFTIDAQTPFSLTPRMPCYCLGWYNANANSSFCFLPTPLIDDCVRAETDPVWTAEKSQYATTNDLSVSQRVVLALTQGTNVLAVVTNYNSQVNLPELSLKYLDGDNGYIEVWREGRRIDAATNALHQIEQDALDAGLAAKADKAWGKYTSGLGQEAPTNTTWISTATTVIAGGYEYAKTVTSNGEVWFLAANGMDLGFAQGSTNAFLSISAADGTPIFSIEKTDSSLFGVDPSKISIVGSACVISLPVVAPSHPFARVATNLVNAVWHKETDDGMPAGSPATVSWSGSSGAYVATVDFGTSPRGYCYFESLQEGMTKIVNAGAVDLSGGIYYDGHLYSPTVSGTQLIFERSRND